MSFIYHMVPKNMEGNVLYPLNTLKESHPEIYAEHVKKYEGREWLLERRIERLDCLWNDVLHCSPLRPDLVVSELKKLGKDITIKYFEIPVEMLEPKNLAVFLYTPRQKGEAPPDSDFVAFDPQDLEKYAHLPEATIEYFKEALAAGEKPFLYHLVPHILYKGTIDTAGLNVVTAS